ncbi:MAG: MerR family transcriptional regulator, partial [Acidimicrobiales bacterium]
MRAARQSTADRSHLSIGEVLALLQYEFPDITISKIRFLESQGLIDPERTPSGYRKFYEEDIARLRWILLQQRDKFLPLKVIKDRLREGIDREELQALGLADAHGVDGAAEPPAPSPRPSAAPPPERVSAEPAEAAHAAPAPIARPAPESPAAP